MRKTHRNKHVIVMGAGVAGVGTASELSKKGFHVTLLEQKKMILSGTSDATPGRAGHGFHYIRSSTGKLYLDSTLKVMRRYPECMLGADRKDNSFMKYGTYMIMKNKANLPKQDQRFASLYPPKEILETYEELRDHYRMRISEDPANKLFGEPEDFFRHRDPKEFKGVACADKVFAAVDTREQLLN